jgi:hypothetical protein
MTDTPSVRTDKPFTGQDALVEMAGLIERCATNLENLSKTVQRLAEHQERLRQRVLILERRLANV